jgi:hypothetical protein
MSITSGFFNSVNGDRTYNADDLTNFFDGILTDGVFANYQDEFEVTVGSGMSVDVRSGKGLVMGKYILNNGPYNLSVSAGSSLPRYDAVVMGVSLDDRTGSIYIKEGTPASSPAYPTLLDNTNTKEMCLAYIYVSAGATSISSSNITDKRDDTAVCGYVNFSNVTMDLNVLRNNVTITASGVNNVAIGIPTYDASSDDLFVYLNGLLLEEVNDYMIRGTGSTASIDLANATTTNNKNVFTFVVMQTSL